MSYILDALKKAAEQRSGPPPEVRRLLSAAPVAAVSASRYVTLGIASVSLITLFAVLWMWAHEVPAPTPASARPVASIAAVSTSSEPTQTARPHMAAEDAPRVPLTAIEPARDAARPTATGKRATAAKAAVIEKTPAGVSPAPAPPIVAALPPTPTPATARSDTAKLKVEVIVYSEQRPLRWAFINGRKYVEGDTIDGARIEEILSNAVVLVEDGRRVTLRP